MQHLCPLSIVTAPRSSRVKEDAVVESVGSWVEEPVVGVDAVAEVTATARMAAAAAAWMEAP